MGEKGMDSLRRLPNIRPDFLPLHANFRFMFTKCYHSKSSLGIAILSILKHEGNNSVSWNLLSIEIVLCFEDFSYFKKTR